MGHSLCIVAIVGHFQNALIFRIFAVFSTRFLLRTTLISAVARGGAGGDRALLKSKIRPV